ncbi:MAG: T9SS type A sorting domain-containing protein [candidate division WOR-3 bacterium]|nr:T9SS type A sorting domain-containing protein [candidate division WOR-3 bacterium]
MRKSVIAALMLVIMTSVGQADWATATVAVGANPYAVAVNPVKNKIYVANTGGSDVTVIDGATNLTTTVAVGSLPWALAVNPVTNTIYVANRVGANVTVIDGATNGTVTVEAGSWPYALAVNPVTNKIYVANISSDNVTVIDGATNGTATVAVGANPRAVAVNPVTNKIYVANYGSENVTVIDGATNGTVTVAAGTTPYAVAVNPVTNRIYVANGSSNNVTVIDGATNGTVTVAAGTTPFAVAVNPVTSKIYVANAASGNVTVIDGATNGTVTVAAGYLPYGVALNPVANKIYVANVGNSNVTVIDGATNSTMTVATGSYTHTLAVNPVTNKIYVANLTDNSVTVIDGSTNGTEAVATGGSPFRVAVNPVTNKIYVTHYYINNVVTVIDGATNGTQTVTAGSGPLALAVNPVTNKVYVANHDAYNVTVIETQTVAAGYYPYAVAVNPVTNKIYVANMYDANVTVIDGATNGTVSVATGINPSAVAVNPVTNRIYVTNSGEVGTSLTVIDGETDEAVAVAAGYRPRSVAVNPVTNKIYVVPCSGDLTVIDGATNGTTAVATGSSENYWVAVNPVTNKIYVTDWGSNNVVVITDAPDNDTRVRAAFDPLPGTWTAIGRPVLTGKGVNRSTPSRNVMMGVGNRTNTAQADWTWAAVTSGAATDSITWTYNWGTDSLIWGENFVCAVPLESDAGITNNEGMGSPFAGNLLVYPMYRVFSSGVRDVGVAGINAPVGVVAPGTVTPQAVLHNYGTVKVGFEVTFRINSNPPYEKTVNVPDGIPPDADLTIDFPEWTATEGYYTAECRTSLVGDQNPDNDEASVEFSVAAYGWSARASLPALPSGGFEGSGGWLSYDAGSGLIYAAKGEKTGDFYAFSPGTNTWDERASIPPYVPHKKPVLPDAGCRGVSDGSGKIYMTLGNKTPKFLSYTAAEGWTWLADVPADVFKGTDVAFVNGSVYLLNGRDARFYCYTATTNTWADLGPLPDPVLIGWLEGSWLVFDGDHTLYAQQAQSEQLWAYDLSAGTPTWTPLAGMPLNGTSYAGTGSAGVLLDGVIYALKGNNTREFWKCVPGVPPVWTKLGDILAQVKDGGDICANVNMLFAFSGDRTNQFWRYVRTSGGSFAGVDAGAALLPTEFALSVSPNPMKLGAAIRYSVPTATNVSLKLYDVTGALAKTVSNGRVRPGRYTAGLTTQGLARGVYILKLESGASSLTRKLVIE